MEVVLEMSFLSISNANVKFVELEKLIWRFYITAEVLSTAIQVKLINKRKFVKAALDKNSEIFVIYIAAWKVQTIIHIYLLKTAQIAALKWDKAPIKVSAEYSNYTNIFSSILAMEWPENTDINKYIIK